MNPFEIPVIIPSLEPDDRFLPLLAALCEKGIQNIVVVDDGSGPRYAEIFACAQKTYGVTLLRHAVNLGKGRALKDAFNYCIQQWPDAPGCVTADSDGQHSPECILACTQALCQNPEHLILGVRDFSVEQVPFTSRWGNRITCMVFGALCGVKISDTQTGLRGIPTAFMKTLMTVPGERFEFETNMLIESREAVPVFEVPIQTIYDSRTNHTTHFNPLRDSVRIYAIFAKFLLSSLSSTLVDLSLFQLLVWLLQGILQGWYITVATVGARLASAVFNFRCNQKLVFRSKRSTVSAGVRYAALCCVQTIASAALVTWLYGWWGGAELLVKILVDSLLFFISFQIQRAFVFGSAQKASEEKESKPMGFC